MKIGIRIWILIILIVLSILAIRPSFQTGVVIKSVDPESMSYQEGVRSGEIIKAINGVEIKNVDDYSMEINKFFMGNESKKLDIKTDKNEYIFLTDESPKITVENVPRTNLRTGLDLRGGARALVEPNASLSDSQLDDLIQVSRNRFNVYGLSDINIKAVSDLSGKKYMLVEVAGATPGDLEELVAKQGKFEAKVGNISVFEGGKGDIADVCRNDASCAGISQCNPSQGGYTCEFRFTIYLTESAAQRHADITENISLDNTGQYLVDKLYLHVDDKEVDSLLISANLRGQVTTQISIQGPGTGLTQEEALINARTNMNKLQTVLITGSLPYKLNIVKLDTISPTLGKDFSRLLLLAGLASILLVSVIIFFRYKNIKVSLALLATSFSEIIIILGIAALIRWNLDLPSIAGILATIGTGVDSQIVIMDESRKSFQLSLKERMKRALFIIVSSYLTSVVALIPLYWAGAGLFKGFAITTIIGISAGVFIARPAFAEMIRKIQE